MRVVLLEDDQEMLNSAVEIIERTLPGCVVVAIKTESKFIDFIDKLVGDVDLFVLDAMVRWTDPAPKVPIPPAHVLRQGFTAAGLRCVELLRTKGIGSPIVLLTVLSQEEIEQDLPGDVIYVQKTDNHDELANAIRRALAGQRR